MSEARREDVKEDEKTVPSSPKLEKWYRMDTGWACGGLRCINGLVVEAPPVFRKFIGQEIKKLAEGYEVREV